MAAAVQPNVVTAGHSTQEVVFGVDAKRMLAVIAWRTIDGIALGVGSGASAVLAALGAPVEVWATIE